MAAVRGNRTAKGANVAWFDIAKALNDDYYFYRLADDSLGLAADLDRLAEEATE